MHDARWRSFIVLLVSSLALTADAGVGDPQVKTDHPWYPGELACSTFKRLAATQSEMFERVTGAPPRTDQDRALAAWMWRNLHYAHGEQGTENLWGTGFQSGDVTTREYWTGLYAHGFGLCGTTHAQWTAELNALLGPGRSRTVGVRGHNAFEVWLTGGPYSEGRWALLDHDISTVIFDPEGKRLLSIDEIRQSLPSLSQRPFPKERQHGWPVGGLHADDPQSYAEFSVVEHQPGYAGPPPIVALRRGETLRRHFQQGLDDGRTFVFWGRNYRTADVPGLERSRTWVNQPEKFRGTPAGSGYHPGQARFGNAVYRYQPNFRDGSYREGVIEESDREVVFEFQTPFIIGATPPNDNDWGVYEPGGRNGLVVSGQVAVPVTISVDRGATWQEAGELPGRLDLTDHAKGHRQYWLKFHQPATKLAETALEIVTVCQANPALFPRLKDNGSVVTYAASGQAMVSAGPNRSQAAPHIVDGAFDTPRVTLELAAPRGGTVTRLFAAAHVASSNPPDPAIRYQIEYSLDRGRNWLALVKDGRIIRRGQEPAEFWSQSLWSGAVAIPDGPSGPVRVRFRNDGGKRYLRAEAHLAYAVPGSDACRVTFAWSENQDAQRTAEHTFTPSDPSPWKINTERNVTMRWVEFAAVP